MRWPCDAIRVEEYADVAQVVFTLSRRSTKADAEGKLPAFTPISGTFTVDRDETSARSWSCTFKLDKYDEEGYLYDYVAVESGLVMKDGTTYTTAEAAAKFKWSPWYSRTLSSTTAVNTRGGGGGHFTISKAWRDSGDVAARGNVQFRIYRKDAVRTYLSGLADTDTVDWAAMGKYAEYELTAAGDWSKDLSFATLVSDMKDYTYEYDPNKTKAENDAAEQAAKQAAQNSRGL